VLLGAPLATATGQLLGWRTVFLLIAAVFALAFAAIALAVPFTSGNLVAGLRQELLALRLPQVWLAITFGVLGFGGMFAVITYIAPISTTVTGLSAAAIPIVQLALGAGVKYALPPLARNGLTPDGSAPMSPAGASGHRATGGAHRRELTSGRSRRSPARQEQGYEHRREKERT
jgi:hypothetical protein